MQRTSAGGGSIGGAMGRCHDFGVQIRPGCEHPMQAGESACVCKLCDSVCEGQFNGCGDVWARGPRPVHVASTTGASDLFKENGHVNGSAGPPPTAPPVSEDRAAGRPPQVHQPTNANFSVLDRPETSMHALRTDLGALGTAMSNQQAVVTQLIGAYSDLRRAPESESLLGTVKAAVEEALARHEASGRESMMRDARRLEDLLAEVRELRAEHRAHKGSVTTSQDELRSELRNARSQDRVALSEASAAGARRMEELIGQVTELAADQRAHQAKLTAAHDGLRAEVADALARERVAFSEALAAGTRRIDELVGQVRELTADQRAHQQNVATAQDSLGTEVKAALLQERAALSEALAASSDLVNDAVGKVRGLATELSAATIREVRDSKTHTAEGFSGLRDSLIQLEASMKTDREANRETVGQWLGTFGQSINEAVAEAVTKAVDDSEDRMSKRFETAVGQLRRSLKETEDAWTLDRSEAAEAEGERLQELRSRLMEMNDALQGTHALAAAQQEETELLDTAMRTLQQWLVEMSASVDTHQSEIREELARQQRSSSALIKRQLRPITESLPELVADAVQRNEEETLRRIEKAMEKVRRSQRRAPAGPGSQK